MEGIRFFSREPQYFSKVSENVHNFAVILALPASVLFLPLVPITEKPFLFLPLVPITEKPFLNGT
jgi:hypothetical protein